MESMGEVIDLEAYRETKTMSSREDVTARLAQIALEKLLLQSEENRLKRMLTEGPRLV